LLNEQKGGGRWLLKLVLLRTVYRWPRAFLYVGQANRDYYRAFGVPEGKLFPCPHSIEVERFAEPDEKLEQAAAAWRRELGVPEGWKTMLFAGKFEGIKRPVPLMDAFLKYAPSKTVLIMVGDGEHGAAVRERQTKHADRFIVLPFQNQSRMPQVYRLGDWVVLPSASETWGLAVNEALACGRRVLVSDRVGCQADVIRLGLSGEVFRADDWADCGKKLAALPFGDGPAKRAEIKAWAKHWSIEETERTLIAAVSQVLRQSDPQ
jgi:glycosyltransferase involved in cell wall biosynthesis